MGSKSEARKTKYVFDSSDDDKPLRSFKKAKKSDYDSSDDNKPLSSLRKTTAVKVKAPTRQKKPKPTAKTSRTFESDSENENPLVKSTKNLVIAPKTKKIVESEASSNEDEISNEETEAVKSRYGVLIETTKGQLIQKILNRWWYCSEWPRKGDIAQTKLSRHTALTGHIGCFLSTKKDHNIGKISNQRDPKTSPTFTNLSKKSCEELKAMLESGLLKQKEGIENGAKRHNLLPKISKDASKKIESDFTFLRNLSCSSEDKKAALALKDAGFEN
mmetsp:Transcript_17167/g.25417  ORF Transcript_17167/g.25417 Transcript_17167/m.25417 type:complete len:274 (+) Transcript_17167:41-862(+)|eukprot:CAMPEP_0171461264 /NCGR_PEP_ID=MMETSP0945-20130129/5783_1 /TAXON_ID=109269 /ORGANISM="Vaucheria litorea, Strain CCMP2940" /LENGTH=273 /DNA_ID=CAMNT_0011987579 /DNA_START=17 /DNA_END=838 /DNA_ORIENTATION=-